MKSIVQEKHDVKTGRLGGVKRPARKPLASQSTTSGFFVSSSVIKGLLSDLQSNGHIKHVEFSSGTSTVNNETREFVQSYSKSNAGKFKCALDSEAVECISDAEGFAEELTIAMRIGGREAIIDGLLDRNQRVLDRLVGVSMHHD